MPTFKEQLETDFIPRLKEMIKNENQFRDSLYEYLDGGDDYEFVYKSITESWKYTRHYKARLNEYIEYAAKL